MELSEAKTRVGEGEAHFCKFTYEGRGDFMSWACYAHLSAAIKSGRVVNWFIDDKATRGASEFTERWHSMVFDENLSPWASFVEHLKTSDDIFELTENYFCYSPQKAIEAGFGINFQMNFLQAYRMYREDAGRNLDPFMRLFKGDSRELILGVCMRLKGAPVFERGNHTPVPYPTRSVVKRFLSAEPLNTAPDLPMYSWYVEEVDTERRIWWSSRENFMEDVKKLCA